MNEPAEYVELALRPIPPDTVASAKQEIVPLIEQALRNAGLDQPGEHEQVQIAMEHTFPTNEAIIVGLTFMAGVGLETYKFILDVLRDRFEVQERKRGPKGHARKR